MKKNRNEKASKSMKLKYENPEQRKITSECTKKQWEKIKRGP